MIESLFNGQHTLERAVDLYTQGIICMTPSVLKLSSPFGFTFAHFLAQSGHVFKDPEILKLACIDGVTVAHVTALNGHVFRDPKILKLADNDGLTVARVCMDRGLRKVNGVMSALAVMYCEHGEVNRVKSTETGNPYITH